VAVLTFSPLAVESSFFTTAYTYLLVPTSVFGRLKVAVVALATLVPAEVASAAVYHSIVWVVPLGGVAAVTVKE